MKTGVQLYSVREELAKDFAGTLRQVAALGYDGVEFAGLYGHSAEEIKGLCAELGLEPISAHVPLFDLIDDTDNTMATYAAIGCKYVVIPHMSADFLPGHRDFHVLEENLPRVSAAAKEKGMQLLYHNHNFEFEKIGGEWALDVMYKVFPAGVLDTEIDTCWANVGGVDPAAYVKQYAGRAPVVHLKDFWQQGHITGKLFDLIGVEDNAPAKGPNDTFGFRPVGSGCQDMPAILKAAAEAGAGWVIVEQDEPAPGDTRMESIQKSIGYLKTQKY